MSTSQKSLLPWFLLPTWRKPQVTESFNHFSSFLLLSAHTYLLPHQTDEHQYPSLSLSTIAFPFFPSPPLQTVQCINFLATFTFPFYRFPLSLSFDFHFPFSLFSGPHRPLSKLCINLLAIGCVHHHQPPLSSSGINYLREITKMSRLSETQANQWLGNFHANVTDDMRIWA